MKPDLKSLQFHLTNRCNLGCIFCWKSHENKQSLSGISKGKFLDLCRDACEMKPEEITISGGGEPLLRKDLFMKMASMIKNNDIRGNLITNGVLLDEKVSKRLVDEGWDEVIFSIQGYNAKMDERIRNSKGVFEETLESIRLLNKTKNGNEKPKVRLQIVLTKYNSDCLNSYIELANQLDVDVVNFRTVNEKGDELSPEIGQGFVKDIKKAEKLSKKYSIDFRKEFALEGQIDSECRKPFQELVVFADGRVSPCCDFFESVGSELLPKVGSRSLKEIWEGERMVKFRKMFQMKEFPERCKECLSRQD